MPRTTRRVISSLGAGLVLTLAACTSNASTTSSSPTVRPSTRPASTTASRAPSSAAPVSTSTGPSGQFTFAFAGDVHFAERTATRLADDPATVFGVAQPVISAADLSMVNLETAITTGGAEVAKEFHFRAPPVALTALREAGVDLATMANNHAVDYGPVGLSDSLAAITAAKFPVIGIGADAAQAYAPYRTTIHGVPLAVFAASQVQDETLANYTAGDSSAGIANAYSDRLVAGVRAAHAAGDTVVVYVHWGTEYTGCPNQDQQTLAATLAGAGADAVIGTHAHRLQGAGWRSDGTYVAYGLSNYLWWRSFGNQQDDAGVLTLTFRQHRVIAARFSAAHLDDTGVPVPATGSLEQRIDAEWETARQCADLSSTPPT